MIPIVSGLAELADAYDGFILDVWGVIHDGIQPYPGAVDALRALRAAGKRTVLLSNAPRRAQVVIDAMTPMGIGRDLYGGVMTSGEAVHHALATRTDPWYAALGRRCFHLGPERDRNIVDGLDLTVTDVAHADFILNTGPEFTDTAEDWDDVLHQGAARRLPMICANPDKVVVRDGRRLICAGLLAERYHALGAEVSYRGKPDPAIYDVCLAQLGLDDRRRVLAIGDAFHTDMAGAHAAGLDALLVTGGIHAEDLGAAWGQSPDPGRLSQLAAEHGLTPTAAVARFVW